MKPLFVDFADFYPYSDATQIAIDVLVLAPIGVFALYFLAVKMCPNHPLMKVRCPVPCTGVIHACTATSHAGQRRNEGRECAGHGRVRARVSACWAAQTQVQARQVQGRARQRDAG